jgi:SAM-dependent methyltransferase
MLRNNKSKRILEFGCGTGILLKQLQEEGFTSLMGYEPSQTARDNSYLPIQDTMPDGSFDIILILDVLEHIEDDRATLDMLKTHLAPGGSFIISVPAFMTIWSEHDEKNHHYRRYTKRSLLKLIGENHTIQVFYWNFTAFILKIIGKLFRPKDKGGIEIDSSTISGIYWIILLIENQLIYWGVRFPVGASVFAITTTSR